MGVGVVEEVDEVFFGGAVEAFGDVLGPEGAEAFGGGGGLGEEVVERRMDGFFVEFVREGAVVEFGAGLADIPIVGVVLEGAEFEVGEGGDVGAGDLFGALGHDAVDASAVGEVDGVSADVGVVPVEDVDAAVGSDFHAEADPGEVVGGHEVAAVASDVGGAVGVHVVNEDGVLVDVAHEELVAVGGGEGVGEVEAGAAVGGEVGVVADGLDGVVGVGIKVGAGLFVVVASLHDVEEVGDDAAGCEAVADVIEVEAPGVGEAAGEDFEFLGFGVEAPDAGVEVETVFFGCAWFSDEGVGEDALAAVEPAVGSPDEGVEGFVPVLHAPSVVKDFGFGVGDVVAVCVGNEDEVGWGAEVDAAMADGDAGGEGEFVVEEFFGIEDAIAIGVLKNLDAAELFVFVGASVDVVVVLDDPDAAAGVVGEGDGFADVGFGSVDGDLEVFGDGHFGDGFLGTEEGGVAGAVLFASVLGVGGDDEEEEEKDPQITQMGADFS